MRIPGWLFGALPSSSPAQDEGIGIPSKADRDGVHGDPDDHGRRLLNLAFSTQAAYAAPLILLAQTRQADRDKDALDHLEAHREEVMGHLQDREAAIKKETADLKLLIEANTALTREDKALTERVEVLTREIHARLPSR